MERIGKLLHVAACAGSDKGNRTIVIGAHVLCHFFVELGNDTPGLLACIGNKLDNRKDSFFGRFKELRGLLVENLHMCALGYANGIRKENFGAFFSFLPSGVLDFYIAGSGINLVLRRSGYA